MGAQGGIHVPKRERCRSKLSSNDQQIMWLAGVAFQHRIVKLVSISFACELVAWPSATPRVLRIRTTIVRPACRRGRTRLRHSSLVKVPQGQRKTIYATPYIAVMFVDAIGLLMPLATVALYLGSVVSIVVKVSIRRSTRATVAWSGWHCCVSFGLVREQQPNGKKNDKIVYRKPRPHSFLE